MNEDRMDFKEFTDMIRQNIRDYLPETYRDAEVKIEDFQKLNQHYLGMQVKKEGQTVVPTINLDSHFKAFQRNGGSLSDMDSVLRAVAQEAQSQLALDTEWLKDYSQVKDRLYLRVSNAQDNAYFLAKAPHREVDGLAVSYCVAFDTGRGIEASTPVTYDMMKMYGISEEQLHQDALESSINLLPTRYASIAEVMNQMMGIDTDMAGPAPGDPQLMVLTNDQALHGAGALFYPNQMESIAEQFGSDFFVLPSSIHEVLILPDDGTIESGVLEAMVQDVNMTTVAPEEVLSDHVYHYDAKDHILEKAATFELRMEQKEAEIEKAALHVEQKAAEAEKPAPHMDEKKAEAEETAPRDAEKAVPSQEDKRRDEKKHPGRGKEEHRDSAKKERRSVLSRLSEKKEQVKKQPHKDVPAKKRETEL